LPHHRDADSTRRCTATCRPLPGAKRREQCCAWPLAGTLFCRAHTPERTEQRCEQARLRRAAEARQRNQTVRDLLALVVELFDAELGRPGDVGEVLGRRSRTVRP
jgi:hypothetical protein